jgi:PII-like signaling protein
MKSDYKAKRLRIYISSTDKFKHSPLYEVIVYSAVIKGIMGYGASSEIYSSKLWEISEKLPLIVEIIDESNKIDTFFKSIKPYFDKVGKGHIITVEETTVIMHRAGKRGQT